MKRHLLLALTLFVSLAMQAQVTVEPDGISITKPAEGIHLYVGDTCQLTATVYPANASDKSVRWSSEDPSVATIAPHTGIVKARGVGSATIIAKTSNNLEDFVELEVLELEPIVQPTIYTIRFLDWNGTELQSSQVGEYETPVYNGATPTRAGDNSNAYYAVDYTFTGWSPSISAATSDADYTAQYKTSLTWKGNPDVVVSSAERSGIRATTGFAKEGVTLTFAQGSGSQAPGPGNLDYYYPLNMYEGNTLTIRSADTIVGIDWGTNESFETSYFSSGQIYANAANNHACWVGETTELVFTVPEGGWDFAQVLGQNPPAISIYLKVRHESLTLTDGKVWPDAALLYDFNGNGYKGGWLIDDYANGFAPKSFTCIPGKYFGQGDYLVPNGFMEDINRDGIIDGGCFLNVGIGGKVGSWSAIDARAAISEGDSYRVEDALLLHNCDLNNDGRPDMLQIKGGNGVYYYNILYQQVDGSFSQERMDIMTEQEYLTQFQPSAWSSTNAPNTYGLFFPPVHTTVPFLSGVSLSDGHSPKRRVAKAPGMGTSVTAPTKAIDMNADGRIDLVDEAQGIVYYNMGDGKWVSFDAGGEVHTADLNNDGFIDFIYPGTKLQTLIYDGNGSYRQQTLFQNIQVDPTVYVYDFDRDGDVDILVTFSAPANSTDYAYTMFFQNDGQGNFTQLEEQDYGELQLVFAACQDINGDGYFDMLAFVANEGAIGNEVYVLYGQTNMTFAPAQKLYDLNLSALGIGWEAVTNNDLRLHVEDIDNDGKMEIWTSITGSDQWNGYHDTYIFKPTGTIANTAPTAPAQPEIIYENGMMRVSWSDGSDAETSTGDLTYALRIGTTSGGSEIVTPHANADGSRKDFLDGNMGKNRTCVLDLRSYAPSNIYVSVQTIDAQHKGSAWSQEATASHNVLQAFFTVDKKQVLIGDTVQIVFTAMPEGYTHTWDLVDAQEVQTQTQSKALVFPTEGVKTLTHTITAPYGATASYIVNVEVLPVSAQRMVITSDERGKYYQHTHELGDYNFDGYMDVLYDNTVYKGAVDYTFTKPSGIWNTGLEVSAAKWFDWTHNGAIDLLMQKSEWNDYRYVYPFSYLPHNGTGNMTATQTDPNLPYWPTFRYSGGADEYYDLLHDGYFVMTGKEALSRSATDSYAEHGIARNADGTWSVRLFTGLPDGYTTTGQRMNCIGIVDMDKDGFLDLAYIDYRNNPLTELKVAFNRGNLSFDTLYIPFAQGLANIDNAGTKDDVFDMREPMMADINSDGYMDIVAFRNDKAPYILYNENNERFSEPVILPVGELKEFVAYGGQIADLDNNGYPDILILQKAPGTNANVVYGVYAYFMNADGVKNHGFISEGNDLSYSKSSFQVMHVMPDEWFIVDTSDDAWRIKGAANTRPEAPTNVRAVQTGDGLLVEWASAADDYTPASQMRYNLSVKHAGQTGNGAFVISPQNGLNANAAALLNYSYISANRYLIPISYLSVGEYEIQLQAVDMQNAMSTFSPVVTVAVDRAVIDAPTAICASDVAVISYMGEDRTGTPQWDFDGGVVASGSGFGPYNVTWDTAGIKTITLTLGTETFTRTLLIDKNDIIVSIPHYLFEGNTTTLDYLPKDMTAEWQIEYRGQWRTLDENGINGVLKDKLNVKDGVFTVGANATQNEYLQYTKLKLTLTNSNGCTSTMQQPLTILSADDIPQIGIVEPDANGHNEIVWGWTVNTAMFTEVEVLKETNIYNQFVSLGVVPATNGYFTDLSSQADQRAERYAIIGIMPNAIEAPRSDVHQTVHLNINRGITDNTFNLIWNAYQGTEIATYSILRGTSAETLQLIASLSGANTSYTDYAPSATETYYAIEYYLPEEEASVPRRVISSALSANSRSGRSNVVNRAAANTIVYTQSMTIMSANKQYSTTADQPLLLLYAEVKPSNTTIKAVQWEITNGTDLATIDPSSGLLTARTPNTGGVVTVKATAKDGSGISATKQITIAAIADTSIPEDFYYTIHFVNWDGTELQSSSVKEGETPVYNGATPTRPDSEQYTYTFAGWSPTIVAVTEDATYTAQYDSIDKTVVVPKNYLPYNLNASVNGHSVTFTWSVQDLPTYFGIVVYLGSEEIFNGTTIENNTSLTLSGFEQPGIYTWYLCSVDENKQPISEWVTGPQFTIAGEPITVRLYPTNAWDIVYLYAWMDGTNEQVLGNWPGTQVSKDADGWWSYTFDSSVQLVNIIWNNGAGEQTVDITGVSASTCYRLKGANHYSVDIIDCSTPLDNAIDHVQAADAPQKVLINNQIFILRGDKIYTTDGREIK